MNKGPARSLMVSRPTLYVTPGHMPGGLSLLIPVKDRGTVHLAALWGGTGMQFSVDEYTKSAADLRPVAGRVACPALIVTGRHDPSTPPAGGRWLGDQIRGARVVDLEAAHLSNVERAGDFNVAVRDVITAA